MNTNKIVSNCSEVRNSNSQLCEQHLSELKASGLTEKSIELTGHFTINDALSAKEQFGINHFGLVIQFHDPHGKPYLSKDGKPWVRIKPNDWDNTVEDAPKYLSRAAEGNRPYFSRIYPNWETTIKKARVPIAFLEGEKKADCLCQYGIAAIGLCGVYGFKDKRQEEGEDSLEAIAELEEINWEDRIVYLIFDSDVVHKKQVKAALFDLATWLTKRGANPQIVLLPTEIDGSKNGADDFVVRHGITALKSLQKLAFPAINTTGKKPSLNLPSDPKLPLKIAMLWACLKETWAFRPGVGWYEWTGQKWVFRPNDTGGICSYFELDLIEFMNQQKWEEQGSMALSSLVRQLKAKLLVSEERWNPDNKLGFANGTLDLRTGNFTGEHLREDYLTTTLPYEYNLSAECPTWLAFLDQALKSDTSAVELIQAILKWILLPKPKTENAEIQKCFDFVGRPGTGKGTVLEVVTGLVGSEACGAVGRETFKTPAALANLLDTKVAIDYDASGFLADVGLVNKVVSNERIPLKRVYKDVSNARLGTVLLRAYNRFLEVPDGSEGLDRRIVAIAFNAQPPEIDPLLGKKLKAELPGIFAWAWQVSTSNMKQRILWAGTVESVADASVKRFEANNPEFVFLSETYSNGATDLKPRELYRTYQEWCKDTGIQSKKERKFYDILQSLGCKQSDKINGYRLYSIPSMKDFDVIGHLGIARPSIEDRLGRNEEENRGRNEDASNPLPESNREKGRNEAQNFLLEDDQNSSKYKLFDSVSPYLPMPCQESVSAPSVSPPTSPPTFPPPKPTTPPKFKVGDRVCSQATDRQGIVEKIEEWELDTNGDGSQRWVRPYTVRFFDNNRTGMPIEQNLCLVRQLTLEDIAVENPTPSVENAIATDEPDPTPSVENAIATAEPDPTPSVENAIATAEPDPTPSVEIKPEWIVSLKNPKRGWRGNHRVTEISEGQIITIEHGKNGKFLKVSQEDVVIEFKLPPMFVKQYKKICYIIEPLKMDIEFGGPTHSRIELLDEKGFPLKRMISEAETKAALEKAAQKAIEDYWAGRTL